MVVRVILASILAAVVLFFWGYLFWAVLPLGSAAMEEEPFGGEALVTNISKVLANTGVYFLPFPTDLNLATEEQQERFRERHQEGPLVRIFYNKAGAEPGAPALFIKGFAHYLGIAFLTALILAITAPALPTYTRRVCVAFLVGAVAAAWMGFNEAIWFYHPWKYELYQAGYVLVGGLLMGLVHAAIVKAPAAVATASPEPHTA